MAPTWYLGPAGDLRPMDCPDQDIEINQVRYGGVHQGLTGARTVDVLGFRYEYTFNFTNVEYQYWSWFEALHTRHVRGPIWLLNPMRINRLSTRATSLDTRARTNSGVVVGGAVAVSADKPAGVDVGSSLSWSGRVANDTLKFDAFTGSPVRTGETLVASIYLKASASTTGLTLQIDWINAAGAVQSTTTGAAITASTTWTRYSTSAAVPAGAAKALVYLKAASATNTVYVAAPQLEAGSTATPFQVGGAATLVEVDQLTGTSHRYPLMDVGLTLLEV